MVDKLITDMYVNYGFKGEKRANVTPEKRIPRNKRNIKSLAMSPRRKDPVPSQEKNDLGLQKYQCLPPQVF